jgi:WD40 repeat protein
MATGGKSGVVAITDMQTHAVIRKLTIGAPITSMDFSFDGTMLAAGTEITSDEIPKGSKVVVWKVPAYKELTELPADDDVGAVCFSRSPLRILVGDRHATVYALPSGKKIWTQAIGYSPGAAISPNGAVVLCGNGFFNVDTNHAINAKYNQYTFAAFSRKGDIVVGGGEEDPDTLYDATTCKPISDLDLGTDNSYALSPSATHMASGNSDDATITIYYINVALLRKSGYFVK